MSKNQSKVTNLAALQASAEQAAKTLRAARTTLKNAKASVEKAEAAYSVAQSTFQAGVEQVNSYTKVI